MNMLAIRFHCRFSHFHQGERGVPGEQGGPGAMGDPGATGPAGPPGRDGERVGVYMYLFRS